MPKLTTNCGNNMVNAGVSTPGNAGKIRVYTGTQPSTGGGSLSGNTLLVEFTLPNPAFGSASGGVITANTISAAVATNTGTATWFRMLQSDGTTVILDGTVGTSASDLNLTSTSITTGDTIAVTSMTVTMPLI